jgi:hypothetical protein
MNEQELKEKLHSTLIAKSKISDVCEDLHVKYLEKINQYNQVVSLSNELLEVNNKLQSVIENERKSYAELKKSYTELEESVTLPPGMIEKIEKSIKDTKHLLLSIESMNY